VAFMHLITVCSLFLFGFYQTNSGEYEGLQNGFSHTIFFCILTCCDFAQFQLFVGIVNGDYSK
jgi:hypothetical protein